MKNTKLILILFLFTLIICSNVSAIGIAPARAIADYVDDFQITINYTITSTENEPIIANIGFDGPLKEYATVSESELELGPNARGLVQVVLRIPKDHGFVGKQFLLVQALQKPPTDKDDMFIVTTGIEAVIIVHFPYPGKYLEVTQNTVQNLNEGENTTYTWSVVNRGDETTVFLADYKIFDTNEELILTGDYPNLRVAPQATHTSRERLVTDKLLPGTYSVNLSIDYSTEKKSQVSEFIIGFEDVELIMVRPIQLEQGKINQIQVIPKSKWAETFDNVYAQIKMGGITATTPSKKMKAFEEIVLDQFIDTRSLELGIYNGTVTIFFDENSKEFPITFEIIESKEEEIEQDSDNLGIILVIIMLAILLVAIIILLLMTRKPSEKND